MKIYPSSSKKTRPTGETIHTHSHEPSRAELAADSLGRPVCRERRPARVFRSRSAAYPHRQLLSLPRAGCRVAQSRVAVGQRVGRQTGTQRSARTDFAE